MTEKRATLRGFLRPAAQATTAPDWDAVYTDLLPRVYNFFLYRVENHALAEDLTATTLERAWRGRSRYSRDLSAFPTWVFGIARHVAADHFRHHDHTLPLEHAHEHAADMLLEDAFQQRHQVERLLHLLATLPERERELIALKYGADLSTREIAGVLRLTETNVSTLLHRIVGKLRAEWDENDPTE